MKKVLLLITTALFVCGTVYSQTDNNKNKKKTSKIGSFVRKTVEASTGLNVSNDTYVTYDEKGFVKDRMEVEFVGCYGDSHTGDVYTVVRIKAKQGNEVYLGQKSATTAKGKMYKVSSSSAGYKNREVSKGRFVEISLEDTPIKDVPTTVKEFEVIELDTSGWYFNIHNVPIQWDVKPE